MNHKVSYMEGKKLSQEDIGAKVARSGQKTNHGWASARDSPGKPLTISSVSENTQLGERDWAQPAVYSFPRKLFPLCL